MKHLSFLLLQIIILFLVPILSYAEQRFGIGGVAQNMMDPVSVLSDFVHSACLLVGGAFIFTSILKYVEHRRSPLMIPISTVIFLFLSGVVLVLLPLISYVTSNGIPYSILK